MEGRRRDRDDELPDRRALLPLQVACAIGVCDSVVALSTAVLSRPDAVSIAVGLCWVAAWAVALATAPRWAATVAAHGWLLVPLGLLALVPALFDGGYPGNLATQPMWIALVAAALAGWRVTIACGTALCAGKLALFLATGTSLATLSPWYGERSEATTATLAPLAVALLGLAGVAVLRHVLSAWATEPVGAPAAMAAPEQAAAVSPVRAPVPVAVGAPGSVALAATAPSALPSRPLSPAEAAVVALLADGLTPKQIAHQRGTSLATVRTQIKRAKRATSARTLDELVASAWRPG